MKITFIKKLILFIGLIGWLWSFSGCGSSEEQSGSSDLSTVKSQLARTQTPAVDDADLDRLIADNNAFAFDLYQKLRTENGNLFYSPLSISMALSMVYAGARGETATQMAQTMHYALSQEKLHPAFNRLDLELNARRNNVGPDSGDGFTLRVVNAIWGQKGKSWLSTFLDTLAVNYGAGLCILDFMADPEAARQTINGWVAGQTEQKIQDLLPKGAIDSATRMVLTNAIYFKASWAYPFDKSETNDDVFTLLDSSSVTTPTMNQTGDFPYAAGDGYVALALPYAGDDLSMIIVLPESDQFQTFESLLTAEKISDVTARLTNTRIALSMPLFQIEDPTSLSNILGSLGMTLAFLPGEADFSGMDGTRALRISEVLHKAFVNVNEEGTEAAAATAVIIDAGASPSLPVEVKVNRPFIFLIRDKTGVILFIGRVVNPQTK